MSKTKLKKAGTGGNFDLAAYLARSTEAVNAALDQFLPGESTKPATIHKAMRYSLFAGGKRMRPALCLAAAEACGGKGIRRDAAGVRGGVHPYVFADPR